MKRALEFFLAIAALALGGMALRGLLRRPPAETPFAGSPADRPGPDVPGPADRASWSGESGGRAVTSLPALEVSTAPRTFRRESPPPPPTP